MVFFFSGSCLARVASRSSCSILFLHDAFGDARAGACLPRRAGSKVTGNFLSDAVPRLVSVLFGILAEESG